MPRPLLKLVTPALASANNGNWQTAQRWRDMLDADYQVELADHWSGMPADLLVALHARRSAASIARWAAQFPRRPLVLVLTGTDLYRDIAVDPAAQQSLALASRLIVLHEGAIADVPAVHRSKAVVCMQSTPAQIPLAKDPNHLRAVMVGHLRQEKAPQTYFNAARLLAGRSDMRLDHIGAALDPALADEARATQAASPHYRWLGEQPHGATLAHIRGAHVLVHTSRIEGGAHAVMEAICAGTPVLATRIAGNVGLLGAAYGGYVELDDAAGLARLLQACRDSPAILPALAQQCAARAPLFTPARERATLLHILNTLLEQAP